ncbi:hypothetical protein VTK73DRAFT_1616 [Phialemonium thermophilum]|uniref:Heterokaryon incompatibility domain-containing protein n=1 Tax=Phialemonium thermophilum TaxID=223376 RepID=A0ABR3X972_9PEZI
MICIDQIDVGEKKSQIPLVRDIYARASSVIIWINEDDSRVSYAFRYLRHIVANRRVEATSRSALFDLNGWDAVRYLLNCDWFHRTWVLQESVVSKDAVFLCASDAMSINELFSGIDMAVSLLLARPREVKMLHVANVGSVRPALALKELKKHYSQTNYHLRLLWLLEHFRFMRTTLAHDRIYSLLGLCSSEEATSNPIRYDLEPEEVYKTFVASHARLYNNLDFLGLCTPAQRGTMCSGPLDKLMSRPFAGPSWVPNWPSKRLRRCLGLNNFDTDPKFFNVSDGMPITMSFQGNGLVVSGVRLDQIRNLGGFCYPERRLELSDANSRLFQQYFEFWTTATERRMPYKDKRHLAETFARTISLLGIYLDPVPSPIDIPDMFCRWCRDTILGRRLAEYGLEFTSGRSVDEPKTFIRMKRLISWEPFVTAKGYIGLAREQSCVGDEIWLVGGSSVPLLLSPQTDNTAYFKVKGEVFLDGFMFGETMRMEGSGLFSVQRITLV